MQKRVSSKNRGDSPKKEKSPQQALDSLLTLKKSDPDTAKSLAAALLASLEIDFANIPLRPKSANQAFVAAKGVARPTVEENGLVLTPTEAFEWLSTLPGAPTFSADAFRQKFRQEGQFKKKFGYEAYREQGNRRIVCTYAQAILLAGFEEYPTGVSDIIKKLKANF